MQKEKRKINISQMHTQARLMAFAMHNWLIELTRHSISVLILLD